MIRPISKINTNFRAIPNKNNNQKALPFEPERIEPINNGSGCLKYIVLGGILAAASFVGIKSCVESKNTMKEIQKTVQTTKDTLSKKCPESINIIK